MLHTMLFSRGRCISKTGGGCVTGLSKLSLYFRTNYMVLLLFFKHLSQSSTPFFILPPTLICFELLQNSRC